MIDKRATAWRLQLDALPALRFALNRIRHAHRLYPQASLPELEQLFMALTIDTDWAVLGPMVKASKDKDKTIADLTAQLADAQSKIPTPAQQAALDDIHATAVANAPAVNPVVSQ